MCVCFPLLVLPWRVTFLLLGTSCQCVCVSYCVSQCVCVFVFPLFVLWHFWCSPLHLRVFVDGNEVVPTSLRPILSHLTHDASQFPLARTIIRGSSSSLYHHHSIIINSSIIISSTVRPILSQMTHDASQFPHPRFLTSSLPLVLAQTSPFSITLDMWVGSRAQWLLNHRWCYHKQQSSNVSNFITPVF